VVRIDRKQVHVALGGSESGETEWERVLPCILRGRFFEGQEQDPESRPIACGDRVRVVVEGEGGAIEEVLPRSTRIARPRPRSPGEWQVIAANVDLLVIVSSLRQPAPKPGLIDRLLVTAESEGIEPLIVLNKVDLARGGEAEEFAARYRALGYRVLATSATTSVGVDEMREAMRGKTAMLLGHSGVGKTSLLNVLDPTVQARIGELLGEGNAARGSHTTTWAALYRLQFGAFLIDTPGIREFGLPPLEPHDLAHWFRDLAAHLKQCRYATCTHDHEPQCAVKAAVERGAVRRDRYDTYLKLLAELWGAGERMQRHDAY
jgi:ribosome biogenesis GTPase